MGGEELSEAQIGELRDRLHREREALGRQVRAELLKSDDERFIELAGRVHDQEDESVASLLADLNYAVIDLHVHRMRDIDAGLERMAAGTYGVCTRCGRDIPFARLRVQPTAYRCIDCQSLHEQTHAHEGHPRL